MDRFEEKYERDEETGCWVWTAGKANGYGSFYYQGRMVLAHRFSYMQNKGDPGSSNVCHHCDNPSCVNPEHLFLCSQIENMADMRSKGRENDPRGEDNGRAKLTEEEVMEIRLRYKSNDSLTQKELAKSYSVSVSLISQIVRHKKWKHLQM